MSPVIGFHDLGKGSPVSITGVSEDQFRTHISSLRERGACFRTLKYWLSHTLQPLDTLVTLDDAFSRQLEIARDVLEPSKIPAVTFVIAGAVGRSASWDYAGTGRRHADWTELKAWVAGGLEVASHAVSHRDLCRLSDLELDFELTESRDRLEQELSVDVTGVAYPFGCSNRRVRAAARAAGYRIGFGTRPGAVVDDLMDVPRLLVSRLDTPLSVAGRMAPGLWGEIERGKQRVVSFCAGGTPLWQELRGDYR